MDVIEFKLLIASRRKGTQKKGELKTRATPTMLLKTHVEKMSVFGYPTIFMKTRDLALLGHDVDENKAG